MKQPQGVYKNYSYNLAYIRIFSRVKLRKIADCDFLRRTAKQKKAAANSLSGLRQPCCLGEKLLEDDLSETFGIVEGHVFQIG